MNFLDGKKFRNEITFSPLAQVIEQKLIKSMQSIYFR